MRIVFLAGTRLTLFFCGLYGKLPQTWLFYGATLWLGAIITAVTPRGNLGGWVPLLMITTVGAALLLSGWLLARAALWWRLPGWYLLHWGGASLDLVSSFTSSGGTEGIWAVDLKFLILLGLRGYFVCVDHNVRRHTIEQFLLVGIARVAGLASRTTDHLVGLYLNLELQALALYALVGYYKERPTNRDAALRYLLGGSLVSARTLVGFARLYGQNGSFCVSEFRLDTHTGSIWVVGRLLFKLGAFPFYFWTPPVYEPLDWATLAIVTGPAKVNLWYLTRVGLSPVVESHLEVLAVAGVASVVVGAVGGYFQTGVTTLLAYSSIINAGYLLLLGGAEFNFRYYLGVYVVGTLILIVVLSLFDSTQTDTFTVTVGLGVGTPLLRYYLAVNLAGLPVFPGFFAKLYLVQGILSLGWGVTRLVVLLSIIPAVYYVGIAVGALFTPDDNTKAAPHGRWSGLAVLALVGGVAGVLNFVWEVV